jgi:hypothetical protein
MHRQKSLKKLKISKIYVAFMKKFDVLRADAVVPGCEQIFHYGDREW